MNEPTLRAGSVLSPVSFLRRSALVFGDCPAVVDGDTRFSYAELWSRATRLAGALRARGVRPGERVAVLSSNSHVLLESHFSVPCCQAVLVALNVRLAPAELGYILRHCEARLLIAEGELSDLASAAARAAGRDVDVVTAGRPSDQPGAEDRYEQLIAAGEELDDPLDDEFGLFSLNYTSGTTGESKGVMYHPRGAYLQALAMVHHGRLDHDTRFLWTLPMFHCNGWCFPWAVTAAGGVHICLRKATPQTIWAAIREEGVTHFNAAPTVLGDLADHPDAASATRTIRVATGGAPPTPALLRRLQDFGMEVTHLYGLTETFGPIGVCEWRSEWAALPGGEQALIRARQGVGNIVAPALRVLDAAGRDVPADGSTMGEVAVAGNTVMTGYFRDAEATERAIPDGWFRTGDLGVMHEGGYLELTDRAKDIIISGGENISSIEVERAIAEHPAVLDVAVVGVADDRFGERPVAFVTLKAADGVTAEELIAHMRQRLGGFKVPRTVIFGPLPKTSTGKVMKYRLRRDASEYVASALAGQVEERYNSIL